MATRNSVAKLIPGNELGSILRETARQARRTSRNTVNLDAPSDASFTALQAEVTALQADVSALQGLQPLGHAVVTADGTGTGTWTYPRNNPPASPAAPVVHATVISAVAATVTLLTITRSSATFKTWDATGAAAPGVKVFLTAFPSTLVP